MLEEIYERALQYELELKGYKISHQVSIPIKYKGHQLYTDDEPCKLRLDLLVDDCVIIELKSVTVLDKIHFKQLTSYLKLLNMKVGVLLNFNAKVIMPDGFGRVVV